MLLKSLGRQTDVFLAQYNGEVLKRDNYWCIKTPSNPDFHWGNFIIFETPPQKGDHVKWKEIFDQEFDYYDQPHHYTFTWDSATYEEAPVQEFEKAGFEFDSGVVLTAQALVEPKFIREDLEYRVLQSDDDWQQCLELQVACSDPKFFNEYYMDFKRKQMKNYRAMAANGRGFWFGAFDSNQLIGDLGIYYSGELGRYQNVGTHPDFRRQGVCANLVYFAGRYVQQKVNIKTLVMEADPEYHAARIYESVGFGVIETNYALSWWRGKDDGSNLAPEK